MKWRPLFVYDLDPGPGTELELALAQRPWDFETETVGGHKKAASGVPEAWTIRRDHILALRVRVWEAELPALGLFLAFVQDTASQFRFHPERAAPGVLCWLESPVQGGKFKPNRTETFGVFEVNIEVRRADGQPWNLNYYPHLGPQ